MSDLDPAKQLTKLTASWGWFVGLGVVMVLLGIYGLTEVVGLTIISAFFIGILLIIGGVVQCLHAMKDREWRGFLLHVLGGVLYIVGGALVVSNPLAGSFIITLMLAASFIAGGIVRGAIAFSHRNVSGWWLLALGGLVSLVLGIFMLSTWPFSALWVLGTFVAIELIINGATLLQFGLGLRAHRAG